MRYVIDPTRVSHERLDDEVIIINMATGAYYSGSGSAADLWTLISGGASDEEAADLLAAAYGSDGPSTASDVKSCIAGLLSRGIVGEADERSGELRGPPTLPPPAGAWTPPSFEEYTDMWDLIQLDPIHDVGEAGWPFALPAAKI